jgi:hypothetical protein
MAGHSWETSSPPRQQAARRFRQAIDPSDTSTQREEVCEAFGPPAGCVVVDLTRFRSPRAAHTLGIQTAFQEVAGAQPTFRRDPANFGRVTSTVQGAAGMPGDARIVQFGLKYSF